MSGTDLGIAWDNGRGQTLLAFGDTFGDCRASGQQWRHNILFRTDDDDPGDGIRIPDARPGDANSGSVVAADAPRYARELIGSLGISDLEMTTIPTAAISVRLPDGRDRQYLNYMSVRSWGSAGHWLTNFSAVAYSDDNGQSWTVDPATVLINSPVSVALPAPLALPAGIRPLDANNGKFQQNAYFRGAGDDPYLYQLGTPNGRFGAAFLARFAPLSIRDLDAYQYWAGPDRGWVDDIGAVPDDGSAIVVPAPVTEASVSWSPYLGKYLMLDGDNEIRMRTADRPEGPWSEPKTIVPRGALILYGPMMMPNSPALQGNSPVVYFNASRWSDYNVMTLRTDLSRVR